MSTPEITHVSWGKVETEDGLSVKDVKLFPGGAREWDWGETGTRHDPGVQFSDVEELLEHGAEVVVLGVGFHERLGVRGDVAAILKEKGVVVYVAQTGEAARLHNELRREEKVGTLIHSTC
ncbi:MAG: MTH938/NDUFAF3 family protein [Actinomycetota bacterium]|jgi:hypothetical protein|nr:MTH938/NDUFAF3 family protein [Actinomycetota bacterium]